MTKKNGKPICVPKREAARPPYEPVRCTVKPECEGCPYPAHGFICWHSDGTCLRAPKKIEPEGEEICQA